MRALVRRPPLLVSWVSCSSSRRAPRAPIPTADPIQGGVIRVAAFGFTESGMPRRALLPGAGSEGIPAGPVVQGGPRELVQPALAEGLINLVPEYAGSALSFLTLGAVGGSANVTDTHDALRLVVAPLNIASR